MKFSKKDDIIIIGAGKISYSLAPAMMDAGYNIKSIISSKIKRAEELADKLHIKNYSDNLKSIKIKRGIFILTVPDNLIRITAKIISTLQINFTKSLIIHLSGSHDVSLLKSCAEKEAHTASFHIMQTFPLRRRRNIKNSFACIETISVEASEYLFRFSRDLKLNPFQLDSRSKVIYHLAGVFASNFINAVLYQSQQLYESLGLKEYTFNDIFAPIYFSTIKNIKQTSPARALSGPIERGDLDTIKKHIREIKRFSGDNQVILSTYISLSLLLIDASTVKSGKFNSSHREIKELLLKELNNIIL
jgi:predicted short-subunit dehydrogenase-like oxidoreductase (DUF2520 family)